MLDLGGKHCVRGGCSSLASPPLPRTAADCGGIPAPRRSALPRGCGTRGAGAGERGWQDGGDASLPRKARRGGDGEAGHVVPPLGTVRLAGPAAEPPGLLGFPGTGQPPPLVRGLRGALVSCGGGWGGDAAPSAGCSAACCLAARHGPHCILGGLIIVSVSTSLLCFSPAFPRLPLLLPC